MNRARKSSRATVRITSGLRYDSAAGIGRLQLPAVAHERFQGVELREPELIVDGGRVLGALLGPHPEFAFVGARKKGRVLLRFVPEDRLLLAFHEFRTERDGPIDVMRLIFLPGAAVEPDFRGQPRSE